MMIILEVCAALSMLVLSEWADKLAVPEIKAEELGAGATTVVVDLIKEEGVVDQAGAVARS